MRITKLKMNHLDNAIGYHCEEIYFSWNVEDTKASYCKELRVVVAVSDCFIKNNIVYDSGILEGYHKNGLDVSFPMKPRTRYYWMVWMTGDNGEEVESDVAYFETGKLNEKWDAKWISTDINTPAMPRFYKSFQVKKEVEKARVYMYGLGLYECYCNGKQGGDEYLLPGYHSYDLIQEYQTFDITSSVQLGSNQFEVILGEGWYKGRFVFEGGYENLYGDERMFLAEIYITYLDGTTEKISSDLTWEAEETSILGNNI
jgi:alpha-L-rhamnosidase